VTKGGTTKAGKQCYRYQNTDCSHYSFVFNPAYQAHRPEVKEQIIDLALNGSGIRDTPVQGESWLESHLTTSGNARKMYFEFSVRPVERVQRFNPRRPEVQIRGSLINNLKQMEDGRWTWKHDHGAAFGVTVGTR